MDILIVNGPNLNLLGQREKAIYGDMTLEEINDRIRDYAAGKEMQCIFFQSNNEGDIISFIHDNRKAGGMVINPAAYTHTSIGIRDAISAAEIQTVEVHLSNIHNREDFRGKSYIAPVCIGQISGFGYYSYILGLMALEEHLSRRARDKSLS